MKYSAMTVAATAAVLAFGSAFGQSRPQQPNSAPPSPQAQTPQGSPPAQASVTNKDLQQFAEIYAGLQKILEKYRGPLASAKSQEDAQKIQAQLQKESFKTISDHGWTVDKYNSVAQAINANPDLVNKVRDMLKKQS